MKKFAAALLIAAACGAPATSAELEGGTLVDLTHPFNAASIYWPTAQKFAKTEVFRGRTDGGFFYSAYDFSAAEHGGTHMDAPIHFAEGKRSADKVPLQSLIGPGYVLDMTRQAAENPDYLVTADDIRAFEDEHGQIPEGAIVLLNFGRATLYSDPTAYMGTARRGEQAVPLLSFPGLGLDGAKLLVERKIGAVGLDTPSIDYGKSTDFATHVELMTHDIPAFENVADMSKLPAVGSTIIALPMKIEGGSGAPLRIVAYVP